MKALNTVKSLTEQDRRVMAMAYSELLDGAIAVIDEFQRLIDAPKVAHEVGVTVKFTCPKGGYSVIFGGDGKPLCATLLKSKYT